MLSGHRQRAHEGQPRNSPFDWQLFAALQGLVASLHRHGQNLIPEQRATSLLLKPVERDDSQWTVRSGTPEQNTKQMLPL